ncbi:MAG: HTH domain-containing protein [Planctomycetes bacterium]|nr:HTH domain-containing protein [Planctomycetota bacterium]
MSVNSTAIVGRHARAIRLLTCLQGGPAFNAKELSLRLNVSRRTIYRDLNLIRDAGIPVEFNSDDSGYRIEHGSDKPLAPPNFNDRDLAKLVLTSQLSVLNSWPHFAMSCRESMTRLLAHYPRRIRETISHLLSCCAVELPKPDYVDQHVETIEMLLAAIVRQKQVRLDLDQRFEVRDGRGTTEFSVYRLIAGLEDWWIVGRSSLHGRTVRIPTSAIRSIRLLDDAYRVPHGFRSRMESNTELASRIA